MAKLKKHDQVKFRVNRSEPSDFLGIIGEAIGDLDGSIATVIEETAKGFYTIRFRDGLELCFVSAKHLEQL